MSARTAGIDNAATKSRGEGGAMTTIHIPPGGGQNYRMIDGDHVVKAVVQDSAGSFEVFEVVAPAAPMAPQHVAPWTGVLYLVEGHVRALVGETSYDVQPGGVVIFPAGTPSTFEVVGDSARILAITSGRGAGRFFADFASSVPADQSAEGSLGAILSVTQRHGVSLVGARVA
jgi:quercetin dioxygenase-like cupin family protein